MRPTLMLAATVLVAGCGGGDNGANGGADLSVPICTSFPSTGDLPCDVAAVLQGNCQHCHSNPPRNGAPFPEVTFEDLEQPFGTNGLRRWQRMAQVIVPGGGIHMPPPGQPQLTDAQLQTLLGWFNTCAPPVAEGSGCDGTDMGVADASMPDDGSSTGGDGGGGPTCVKNGGDCSGGQSCCANLTCTGGTCQPKPCNGLGADCTLGGCCAGLTCDISSYTCK